MFSYISFIFFLRSLFPRERFEAIFHTMLHAGEANAEGADKIEPFLNELIHNFNFAFYPGMCVSLDEMVIGFTGVWAYKQYNPNKPAKHHIKVFGLCDSKTGYVINLLVYFGAKTSYRPSDDPNSGQAKKVFHHLLEPLGTGHHVFADRFYRSYELVDYLKKRQTYYTGTLNVNRKGFPVDIKSLKLAIGERQDFINEDSSIVATAFRDKKAKKHFVVVSTKSTHATVPVEAKFGGTKWKPSCVQAYNHNMNGCDRVDQMVSYYSIFQRKTHKWWKKIFHWSTEIAQNNAYVLYCLSKEDKKTSLLQFKLELIYGLTSLAAAMMPAVHRNLAPAARGRPKTVNAVERVQGSRHLIRFVGKDRDCRHCSGAVGDNGQKKRKRSSFVCIGCTGMPHLCPKFCFEDWHSVH